MSHDLQFYIDGAWVDPVTPGVLDVIDPSTEEAFARISLGSKADVDKAGAAAKRAFPSFSRTTPAERRDLLRAVLDVYNKRSEDLVQAVSREMGAPLAMARDSQVWVGRAHLEKMVEVLGEFTFEHRKGTSLVVKEAIGVVGRSTSSPARWARRWPPAAPWC